MYEAIEQLSLPGQESKSAKVIMRSLRTGIREAQLDEVISAFSVQFLLTPERRSGL